MDQQTFKRFQWLKICFEAIVISLLSEKFVSSCGKDSCERELAFQPFRASTGSTVCCATDAPSLTRRNIRSKIECLLLCQETAECLGANWKTSNGCELFAYIPKSASKISGCSFFNKEVEPQDCSFPYTYQGQMYYGCLPMMSDVSNECTKLYCLVSMDSQELTTCPGPRIFNNITVNLTVPSVDDSFTASMDNNTVPTLGDQIMVTSVNDWVVIQQRVDGSTSFRLPWLDYTNGFGTFNRNFWLGLERMYRITTSNVYRLRLEFRLLNGTWLSAEYDSFYLDDEYANYTLHVSGFSGDGGNWLNPNDPIRSQNGMQFTTYDMDHDTAPGMNCAASIYGGGGGFWYNSCSWIKPHAVYGTSQFSIVLTDIRYQYQLSVTRMMVKAV